MGTKPVLEGQDLDGREIIKARQAAAYKIRYLTHNPEVASFPLHGLGHANSLSRTNH